MKVRQFVMALQVVDSLELPLTQEADLGERIAVLHLIHDLRDRDHSFVSFDARRALSLKRTNLELPPALVSVLPTALSSCCLLFHFAMLPAA